MKNDKMKVLIVDDKPKNIQVAANIIKSDEIDLSFTTQGEKALEKAKETGFDLILLDIMMPNMSGFEICEKLKGGEKTKGIPIIFLTAKTDIESISKAFELGAVDYVTKPFNKVELQARVNTHIDLKKSKDKLKEYAKKVKKQNQILEEKNKELKIISRRDTLTNLYNRRYMIEKIEEEKARFERSGHNFSFIITDIDHFKLFNDNHGHDCGDYVLEEISKLMVDLSRTQDSISRWGGEEFLILLPDTDLKGAKEFALRIKNKLENTKFQYNDLEISISMTFGVAQYSSKGIDGTIKKADEALYRGKKDGRNCVKTEK